MAVNNCDSPLYSHYGKKLLGSTFKTLRVENLGECNVKCFDNDNCLSINFDRISKKCDLNNATKDMFPLRTTLVDSGSSVHFQAKSEKACSRCHANASCIIVTQETYKCKCEGGFLGDGYQCIIAVGIIVIVDVILIVAVGIIVIVDVILIVIVDVILIVIVDIILIVIVDVILIVIVDVILIVIVDIILIVIVDIILIVIVDIILIVIVDVILIVAVGIIVIIDAILIVAVGIIVIVDIILIVAVGIIVIVDVILIIIVDFILIVAVGIIVIVVVILIVAVGIIVIVDVFLIVIVDVILSVAFDIIVIVDFNEILFTLEAATPAHAYFKREDNQTLNMTVNYNKRADGNGLWVAHGVALTTWKYELLICDTSVMQGFMLSGYTGWCYKTCDLWCGDYLSHYYRTSALDNRYSGVSFKENGHKVMDGKLISVGVRLS
ncbi:predicted protein [Nematostella vectensis]|uniref:Apple domain-containing protein n=1 Tax=Nematostella vectensis TaxID=45351 RepID=A7S6L2_NEMVE|nr:predicted protein [Nematostella vectensis]|eukprot:XP_001632736.1 predicted protein [Nematostella vectensis]